MDNRKLDVYSLNYRSPQRIGLRAWWPCIWPGKRTLHDLTFERRHNGTLQGNTFDTWREPSRRGPAIHLQEGNYFTFANDADFEFLLSDKFTLSCWWLGNIDSRCSLLGYDDNNGGGDQGWELYSGHPADSQTFTFRWFGGNETEWYYHAPPLADRWQHLCVTYDGSSDVSGFKLYVNTVLATSTNGGGFTLADIDYTGRHLHIGTAVTLENIDQWLDDIRIYDRELTPTEVQNLFAHPWDLYESHEITPEFLILNQTWEEDGGGGLETNGHVNDTAFFFSLASGSCLSSGTARNTWRTTAPADGGVITAGDGLFGLLFVEHPSGGAVVDGASVQSFQYNPDVSGGDVTGGVLNYRLKITVPAGRVPSDLHSFYLVVVADCSVDPANARCEDSAGNVLEHELREWDGTRLVACIKTPLKSAVDNEIWMVL